MQNPIISALMPKQTNNNLLTTIASIKSGNPNAIYQQMMQSNPQFKAFVDANKGKSPEQIAKENGVDFGLVQNLMR